MFWYSITRPRTNENILLCWNVFLGHAMFPEVPWSDWDQFDMNWQHQSLVVDKIHFEIARDFPRLWILVFVDASGWPFDWSFRLMLPVEATSWSFGWIFRLMLPAIEVPQWKRQERQKAVLSPTAASIRHIYYQNSIKLVLKIGRSPKVACPTI